MSHSQPTTPLAAPVDTGQLAAAWVTDPPVLGWTLVVALSWTMATASLLGNLDDSALAWGLYLLITWTALQVLLAGIAYTLRTRLGGQPAGLGDPWRFVVRRSLGIVVVPGLCVAAIGLAVSTGAHFVRILAATDPLLADVLLVPSLAFLALGYTAYGIACLVPCVMGMEDLGFNAALQRLLRVATTPRRFRRGLALAYRLVVDLVPVTLLSGLLTVTALVAAVFLCHARHFDLFRPQPLSPLGDFAVSSVVGVWLILLAAYTSCGLALIWRHCAD
jgi:hypothetical protein